MLDLDKLSSFLCLDPLGKCAGLLSIWGIDFGPQSTVVRFQSSRETRQGLGTLAMDTFLHLAHGVSTLLCKVSGL